MPSLVMLPFIQCHQVWGRAWAGGFAKPEARAGWAAARAGRERRARAARRRAVCVLLVMGSVPGEVAVYRVVVAAGCGLRYVGPIRPRGRGTPSDTGNGSGLAKGRAADRGRRVAGVDAGRGVDREPEVCDGGECAGFVGWGRAGGDCRVRDDGGCAARGD